MQVMFSDTKPSTFRSFAILSDFFGKHFLVVVVGVDRKESSGSHLMCAYVVIFLVPTWPCGRGGRAPGDCFRACLPYWADGSSTAASGILICVSTPRCSFTSHVIGIQSVASALSKNHSAKLYNEYPSTVR